MRKTRWQSLCALLLLCLLLRSSCKSGDFMYLEEATTPPTDASTDAPTAEGTCEALTGDAMEDSAPPTGEETDETPTDVGAEESTAPSENETEEDIGIVAALAEIGTLPAYQMTKLSLMELYYDRYYIGEMPSDREAAANLVALYNVYYRNTIDTTDAKVVTDALMTCYQQAVGDKYAVYLNEEDLAAHNQDFNAEYTGIGVYVSYHMIENTVQVLAAYEGTPAAKAGILPGDYIVAVDGVPLHEIGYYELVNRIRGEVGTEVRITVVRGDVETTYTMVREKVSGVSVTYRRLAQDPSIGYVKIEQFDGKTAEQFKNAIDALLTDGVTALIFDLRNNGGGQVTAIVEVLDYLVEDGKPLAHFRFKPNTGNVDEHYYAKDGHALSIPMTVLCNGYTASAAELFTSALKDHGMATVIGTQTYGKGTAQSQVNLTDGTAFTISIARYDPPCSENYEGVGVAPDIVEELSEEAEKINAFLRDDAIDNQLQKAVAELDRLRKNS